MKKRSLLVVLFLLFIFHNNAFSQFGKTCLPNGVFFYTQQQIDNFQTDYPRCTKIVGNITVRTSNITNFNGLDVLTAVGGGMSIYNNQFLPNLDGLNNLTFVDGGLYIHSNDILNSLSGLENLTSIEGTLDISHNDSLNKLVGLENLTSIGGELQIRYNEILNSLEGLEQLSTVG